MKRVFGIVALLISFPLFAQELITFSLKANRDYLDVPVSFPLQQVNYNMDSVQLELFEIVNSAEKPVACQVEAGHTAHLWFILEGFTQKNRTRRFVIKRRSGGLAKKRSASMSTKSSDGNLTLYTDDKPVLSYRFRTMYPPEGVNPLFERSGFIHPVWSPQGEMLFVYIVEYLIEIALRIDISHGRSLVFHLICPEIIKRHAVIDKLAYYIDIFYNGCCSTYCGIPRINYGSVLQGCTGSWRIGRIVDHRTNRFCLPIVIGKYK
jgi:hypothetical protein